MLQADLHVHTTASGHGYSTLKEIADSAARKKLQMVAITDHGLNMPGAPDLYHFTNMISLPRIISGVEVLHGVEANILDFEGNVDMPEPVMADYLDIVLAGFHERTGYAGGSAEENTQAMIAAIKNPYVHIISHPGNPKFPVDVEAVVIAARTYNKAIELNNSSFVVRPGCFPTCKQFALMARKHNALVAINSDSHFCETVGETHDALKLATLSGINRQQIVNRNAASVWAFLNWHTRRRQETKPA